MNLDYLLGPIRAKKHFTLRASRQSGKTSARLALRDLLNSGSVGPFRCFYINMEAAGSVGGCWRGDAHDFERIRFACSIDALR